MWLGLFGIVYREIEVWWLVVVILEYLKGVLKIPEEVMFNDRKKKREGWEKKEQVRNTVIGHVRQRLLCSAKEFRGIILFSASGPHYQE